MKKTIPLIIIIAYNLWSCGNGENNNQKDKTQSYPKLILGKWQSVADSTHILIFELESKYEGKYTETKDGKISPNTHYRCHECNGFGEEMAGNRNPCIYLSPKAKENGVLYVLDVLTEDEMVYTDGENTKHKFRKIKTMK